MVIGIGLDLVDISRFEHILKKEDSLFLQRLLTPKELALFEEFTSQRRRAEWVAGRFAAKEALLKALGTGCSGQTSMNDIEIITDHSGKPIIHVSTRITALFTAPVQFHVSITHTETTAAAFVVIDSV